MATGIDALLIEHHEFLGDGPNGTAHLGFGLGEVTSAQFVQRRGLAADVMAHGIDLVGRQVQLVGALVGEHQIVTLDPGDGHFRHALVLGDTVDVVHDVVPGLQVLEDRAALATLGAWSAMRRSPSGDVGLGDDGEFGRGNGDAAMESCHHDRASATTELGRDAGGPQIQLQSGVGEAVGQASGGHVAVGGDDDAVVVGEQLFDAVRQPVGVRAHGTPARGLEEGDVGSVGHRDEIPRTSRLAE